ncbi:MAG: hypothetical protein R3282_01170 [Rhodothermales bacterium]|nr:hypothetical protein [Rhodothermales bacterium]
MPKLLLTIAITIFVAAGRPASGQMDLEDEILSLAGVTDFGLVVDIESTLPSGAAGLDNSIWRDALSETLRELTGTSPATRVDPTRDSHLYVHVNAMSVGDDLVPFAIEASFVQKARVDKGQDMMVVTWETGLVGLVTQNQLSQVLQGGIGVVEEFAGDLKQARLLE